ncbi:CG14829 [Drosophila busckii]|uniref:CG14829 n=1 Tax=Drosophila busckii TaxID=30019 RepID=A0A0M4EHZ8_DROBS|nr:CG14829 [Drosophila busckii]
MQLLLLICLLPLLQAAYDVIGPTQNLTAFLHARQKRYMMVYENGATVRLVVGPVMAIQLKDPVAWRSFLNFYVLHFGAYAMPSAPLYPWDKWETIFERSLHEKIRQLDATHEDDTRLFAYSALEHYMDNASGREGRGRACLLRALCENAQVHHHVGIMAELLNVLLTPGKARLQDCYKEAYAAGSAGVDCLQQFASCPRGQSVLDAFAMEVTH